MLHPWHTAKFVFAMCCTRGTRQSLCLSYASLKHTANPDFAMCLTAAHGKRWWLRVGVSVELAFAVCPVFAVCCSWQRFEFARVFGVCCVQHTTKTRYTVYLTFAVCVGWAHGKFDLYRVLLMANWRRHGKDHLFSNVTTKFALFQVEKYISYSWIILYLF